MKRFFFIISLVFRFLLSSTSHAQIIKETLLLNYFGENFFSFKQIVYASASKNILALNYNDEIFVYDLIEDKLTKIIKLPFANSTYFALSSDENYLAIGNSDGKATVYDIKNNIFEKVWDAHDEQINCFVFYPNSEWLFSCSDDNTIKKWNYKTFALADTFNYHKADVNYLEIKDNTLLSGSDEGMIIGLNLLNRKVIKKFKLIEGKIIKFISNLSDSLFIICDGTSALKLARLNKKVRIDTLRGHSEMITDAILISENMVATSSVDKKVFIWDILTKNALSSYQCHFGGVSNLQKINDYSIASCSEDKTIKIYNFRVNNLEKKYGLEFNPVNFDIDYFNDAIILYSDEGSLRFYDINNLNLISEKKEREIAFDYLNSQLLTSGCNLILKVSKQNISINEITNYKRLKDIKTSDNFSKNFAISQKGHLIASALPNNSLVLININDGKRIFSLQRAHRSEITKIQFINNDRHIASSSQDATLLIATLNGDIYRKLSGHTMPVLSFDYLESKNFLISVSLDGKAIVWDYENNSKKKEIFAHPGGVADIDIAADDSFFATVSLNGEIKLWKTSDWSLIAKINLNDRIFKIKISDDLKYIFCLSQNGMIYQVALVWDGIYRLMETIYPAEFAERKPTEKENEYVERAKKRSLIIKEKFAEVVDKKISELSVTSSSKIDQTPEYDSEAEIARIYYNNRYLNFYLPSDYAEDLIKNYNNYEIFFDKRYKANFYQQTELPKLLKRKNIIIKFEKIKKK